MRLNELHFTVYHNGTLHAVVASPYLFPIQNGLPLCFNAVLNGKKIGDVNFRDDKWMNEEIDDDEFLLKIGSSFCAFFK